MERDTYSSDSSAALRRLLSSHHSVYNALTDPLLECTSPHPPTKENSQNRPQDPSAQNNEAGSPNIPISGFSAPALEDSAVSFSSWQSISLSAFSEMAKSIRISSPFTYNNSRPASASILSNSTNEDTSESLVLVPSLKKHTSPHVLLFETDEEDEADEDSPLTGSRSNFESEFNEGRPSITSSNSQKHASVGTDSSQTFIMPRMSLSDDIGTTQLTIICSTGESLKSEIEQLTLHIQQNVRYASRLIISCISLAKPPSRKEISLARNSDVLLAINDGCIWIPILISSMVSHQSDRTILPSLAIVNLLTSNYFANLFDIIRNLRPQRNFKTPSLENSAFLKKINVLIENELLRKVASPNSPSDASKCCADDGQYWGEGSSMYKSLNSSIEKPDYKSMEKIIRHEMVSASEYHAVDPLRLSSSLSHLSLLVDSLSECFLSGPCDSRITGFSVANNETLWFLCSFSVGIGLGLTLNAFQVFKIVKRTLLVDPSIPDHALKSSPGESHLNAITQKASKIADQVIARLDYLSTEVVRACSDFESWSEISLNKICQEIRMASAVALDSVMSGFTKVKTLFLVWLE